MLPLVDSLGRMRFNKAGRISVPARANEENEEEREPW
jgi:hypothetical protein